MLGRPSCRPWQLLLRLGRHLAEDDYILMAELKLLLANYEENSGLLAEVIEKREEFTLKLLF
jgi:hypothetical protein